MRFSDTQRPFTDTITRAPGAGSLLQRLHLDEPLLIGLMLISALGLFVLYSAVGQNFDLWMQQFIRLLIAIVAMLIVSRLSPDLMRRWTPVRTSANVSA